MKIKYFILSSLFCFCFLSCITLPGTTGKEKVITTFMSSGNLQYYIRPGKLISTEAKDKSFVMIDFTYQKQNRSYVTDAYVNFTLHGKTEAFISEARFVFTDKTFVQLKNISLLRRDAKEHLIRVSTILEKDRIQDVLEALHLSQAVLEITLDDNTVKQFTVTPDMIERLNEAFSK